MCGSGLNFFYFTVPTVGTVLFLSSMKLPVHALVHIALFFAVSAIRPTLT